jgi:hypothetical protein
MNQADILKLSKDAGISTRNIINGDSETIYMEHLTRFAELVAQHEREACAQLCLKKAHTLGILRMGNPKEFHDMADAIRNRERKE